MFMKMFVLGRPGCGKTTVVRHIIELMRARGYEARRKKDYDILYRMFKEDRERADGHHRFQATEYGGFDVLDFSVLDEALQELEREVKQEIAEVEKPGIIIEFARSNYREALSNFNSDFLRDAYFFFVDADLDTCIQRIHQRLTDPPQPDCHFVSDYIMQTYYKESKKDWGYMSDEFQCMYNLPKESIRSYYNMGTVTELLEYATDFVESIVGEEPSDAYKENGSLPDRVLVSASKVASAPALI